MALIQCPHCGKSVTDTSENCIHCGKPLKGAVENYQKPELKNYDTLNYSEKEALKNEFYNLHPIYRKHSDTQAKYKKVQRASTICIVIGIILVIIGGLLSDSENISTLYFAMAILIIGLIVFFVSDIIDIACPFILQKYKKKFLVGVKKYQKWLKDVKKINYVVTFNNSERKWKKYFDEINVDVIED